MKTAGKVAIGVLATAAVVGFGVAASRTNGGKGTTVGGTDYRAKVYLGGEGQWFAQVFVGGKPSGALIGPVPTESDAGEQAAAYLAGLDVAYFYTLHSQEKAPGSFDWFYEGWSRGEKVSEANGPYASEQAAATAASTWVASQIATAGSDAAVGGPGPANCPEGTSRVGNRCVPTQMRARGSR